MHGCRTDLQQPQDERLATPEPVEPEEEEQLAKLPSFEQFDGCYASVAQAMLQPVPGNVRPHDAMLQQPSALPMLIACDQSHAGCTDSAGAEQMANPI